MKKLLKTSSDITATLDAIKYEFDSKARSFDATGNLQMGDWLHDCALELEKVSRELTTAVSMEINSQFNNAMQSSANMINAVIASTKLKKETK